ncbi:arginine--tRNA ligase [Candidatus Kaiserbacteria bacterium CG10_big_fil_rev_8_21_14_0_10_45_20]|uniref:Arginine--tRNA ligase n=1 Tax=Candidatus Kaiserbacteria bacterium CG10_big_fil_rev_8_21_14_0_10_45_20 TaxID=1974607 RepID=A0A2H0UF27_9BACT|nr:MAG: arginine--tRNA ligase [Candidatus Kaiserbacteria bacterium CG10_big_fil_rev_8_21_14_0_10_45_20]
MRLVSQSLSHLYRNPRAFAQRLALERRLIIQSGLRGVSAILLPVIQEDLIHKISSALKALGIDGVEPMIEFPGDLTHGDFATNVALAGAKVAGTTPRELAEKLVAELGEIEGVEKVNIAGPGFINFILSREYFSKKIQGVGETWGRGEKLKGKNILVEYAQPNLFKPFHIGHLLNTAVGESLSRVSQFSGATVRNISYPSDISLGVAKAIWSILKNKKEDDLTIDAMGEAYVDGTKQYEESEEAKKEINAIHTALHTAEDGDAWRVYQKGRALNVEYFNHITARLGSSFDHMFFESESGVIGKEIVMRHTPEVFQESEGAIIFKGEDYGLHTRVFLTSQGLPVYEAKDIGLLSLKFEKYNPDLSIVVTDVEQKQYFEVVKKAASLINKTWGDNSLYWQHGRLRFAGGKVSSRYGNVPLAEDLLEKVISIVSEKAKEEDPAVSEKVALASLKYAFLRGGSGKNIVFDFEKSVAVEGDSGPYLQYSYVRARGVLDKVKNANDGSFNVPKEVSNVERLLTRFPSVVARSADEYEPHYITTYLTELASAFNSWYAQEKVIGSKYEAYYLQVVRAFAHTMKNGLWLLGIEAPEKM